MPKYKLPDNATLNAICPYFTMFPLDFPLSILKQKARQGDVVLDPFCGRGTTNFAARLVGLMSYGVDSSPVAAAITASKLVAPTVDDILNEAHNILSERNPFHIPDSEFWKWAYHSNVLKALCCLREAFLDDCSTETRIALRGIILGALHGPRLKTFRNYFSNQSPRTYAPKPAYAVRYWQNRGLVPENIDVLSVIRRRAIRYYGKLSAPIGEVQLADSRDIGAFNPNGSEIRFDWVITSPPYYGMKTYIPDQWIRGWFMGGPDSVDYTNRDQIVHSSPEDFSDDLKKVWRNAGEHCAEKARLVIRFGGISDRHANPLDLITDSLDETGWRINTIEEAGTATEGKRQADSFLRNKSNPLVEYDVWAIRN